MTYHRISKEDHVNIKTNSGAKIQDICDYIKASICKKPDILLFNSGTYTLNKWDKKHD